MNHLEIGVIRPLRTAILRQEARKRHVSTDRKKIDPVGPGKFHFTP